MSSTAKLAAEGRRPHDEAARSESTSAPVRIKNPEVEIRERYYDAANRRLVYIGEEASAELWDALWDPDDASVRKAVRPSFGVRWLIRLTRRYLKPADGTILEGGCGTGHYVAALDRAGYRTTGIDSAPRTVAALQRVAPELDIRLGDVTRLPFAAGEVTGYWSIGLIEHYFLGYHLLALEMSRVIRPGGYLFLSFPYMSPVRRLKAILGLYAAFTFDAEPAGFYQFVLDASLVGLELEKYGFRLQSFTALSGLKGCKDELAVFRPLLQKLYNYPGSSVVLRGLRWVLDSVLVALGCGHSCVMVFERTGRPCDALA